MINRRAIAAMLLAGPIMTALPGCGNILGKQYPPYRYRVTVEVETPEGLRTGSSVIEVSVSIASKRVFGPFAEAGASARGEAVAVDLGRRGVMFALLRNAAGEDWASGAFGIAAKKVTLEESRRLPRDADIDPEFDLEMQRILALRGPHTIPRWFPADLGHPEVRSAYPMLVKFRDIANPKTVEEVDPDNLAAAFGKGVKLRRIVTERTDDPVTKEIRKRLTWLDSVTGSFIKGGPTTPIDTLPLGGSLNSGDFAKDRYL